MKVDFLQFIIIFLKGREKICGRLYGEITNAHIAKSLRDFPIIRCRQAHAHKYKQASLTRCSQNKRRMVLQASLGPRTFYFETPIGAYVYIFSVSLTRYRSHAHSHAWATCWHWRNWLFYSSNCSFCCKEA